MDTLPLNNKFKTLITKISGLPLWIKQVIYLEIREQMEMSLTRLGLDLTSKEDCFQLYIPKLTFLGSRELETREKRLPTNIYKLLEGISKELTIVEITITNNWNLAECSSLFIEALKSELVKPSESSKVRAVAYYLGGSIRLGEYFVKLGKISIEQLDEVLRHQKNIQETTGKKLDTGEIMVNLGIVSEFELRDILALKAESVKYSVIDNVGNSFESANEDKSKLEEKIIQLSRENAQLKEQIRKILGVKK